VANKTSNQTSNSTSNKTSNANASKNVSSNTNSTGSQQTTSDSGNTTNNKTSVGGVLFIPPVVPETPPSQLSVGNIVKETLACGPLQIVVQTPITGTFFGLFKNSKITQGHTDTLVSASQLYNDVPLTDGRKGYERYGSQVTEYTAIVQIGGARNIALGGGGGQSWGQAGGGTSGSMQQMVTTIQVSACDIGTFVTPEPSALPALVATPYVTYEDRATTAPPAPIACVAPVLHVVKPKHHHKIPVCK
jgi:hypothetical protein